MTATAQRSETRSTGTARLVGSHLVAALIVVGVLAVLGALAGLLWHVIAPRTEFQFNEGVGLYTEPVPGAPIAADGWFAVIALVAGILSGSACHAVFHRRILGAVVGLAVGATVASIVAWQVGHWFGAAEYDAAVAVVRDGKRLLAPLDLRAKGVLTLWPLAATLTVFLGVLIEEVQRRLTRSRSTAPPPRPELPPIREAGDHTSAYPYTGPQGEQGA